jgi:hypothetical protein
MNPDLITGPDAAPAETPDHPAACQAYAPTPRRPDAPTPRRPDAPTPDARRSDRGGGFTNASVLGGLELFCEFFLNRISNSATLTVKATISASRSVSRTNNCSTEGTDEGGDNDASDMEHQPCGGSRSKDPRSVPQLNPRSASHAARDLNGYDLGANYYETRLGTERAKRNHVQHLEALGFKVTLEPAA